jgi:transaldolase/glucose-6-phosphate isomerase
MNPLKELNRLGQSVWYDNIGRGLLTSGEFERMVEEYGVTGITSNPVIFEKAISAGAEYDEEIRAHAGEGLAEEQILNALMARDVQLGADILKPVYEATGGLDGYVSIEVNPALAHDAYATVAEARRLYALVGRRNVLVKVPATAEGIAAIQELVCQGYSINVTLLFSVGRYEEAATAYIEAIERRMQEGKPIEGIFGVASFFVSRVDTLVDKLLEDMADDSGSAPEKERLKAMEGYVAISNAMAAVEKHAELFGSKRFAMLKANGARAQKLLWASTGTKNPLYSDVKYVEGLVLKDTINTMPLKTLEAFLDHGKAKAAALDDDSKAAAAMDELKSMGIDYNAVASRLEEEGVAAFADGFDKLISSIAVKSKTAIEGGGCGSEFDLGGFASDVAGVVRRLGEENFAKRLADKDASLWAKSPKETVLIENALGWLDLDSQMDGAVAEILAFVEEIRATDVKFVVLLGMGGSSLAPLVLKDTFGSTSGYPTLVVLDSTDPEAIAAVELALGRPKENLFIVASKSGSTIEPLSLFEHFYAKVKDKLGSEAGDCFVAITDPGSSLEALAAERDFRWCFLNPPDIGGRYSALSCFGLLPAALTGVDIKKLLAHAGRIHEAVGPAIDAADNPGLVLGAALGHLSTIGRDKVTFVVSKEISSFGLWIEQLLAESTGKDGKGIVPVTGGTLGSPEEYANDRVFVSISVGPVAEEIDAALKALAAAGHPVIRLCLEEACELGGEFLRWEVATAAAGFVLGINPFDQPDVESAKKLTRARLDKGKGAGVDEGSAVEIEEGRIKAYFNGSASKRMGGSAAAQEMALDAAMKAFFDTVKAGDYIGLLAYFNPFDGFASEELRCIRRLLFSSKNVATQFGYGPRYLHSTGQLHKGGADNGVFVILTHATADDIAIPGATFSFSELELSQAFGDMEALDAKGRSVVLLNLADSTVESLKDVAALIRDAVTR